MGSQAFSFKQFTVFHDKCAMKVGTDGVLLGSWANVNNTNSVLDIGTGSGLIALMIAQRCNAQITAIDIDSDAILQSKTNIEASPWKLRIIAELSDLKSFTLNTNLKFDLIVSNPPFFKNSLHTPFLSRTNARHASENFHLEILHSAKKLLNANGRLCLILPVVEGTDFEKLAIENGFFCSKKVYVYPKANAIAKRLLLEFTLCRVAYTENTLVIESNERHSYTEEFEALVKDFYLKL